MCDVFPIQSKSSKQDISMSKCLKSLTQTHSLLINLIYCVVDSLDFLRKDKTTG